MDTRTAHALIRFGLGPRAGEPPPADPLAWLQGQLHAPATALVPEGGGDVASACAAMLAEREARRERKDDPALPRAPDPTRLIFRHEAAFLAETALVTPQPFIERLVWFWTNHFTVSLRQGSTTPFIGDYVRTAIRPHVTGRFEDMVLAVMRHPAMLLYLDNAGSAGPASPAGLRQRRGLNENLARECLELHTLSPASGYTQADVAAFACLLTGWSVETHEPPVGFRFRPFQHEPGAKVLLGQRFEEGEAEGVRALRWLAGHPATHRHLATKLARHFIADDPGPELVRPVEAALRDSRGNLGAAAAALLACPAAWTPLAKLRTPQDFVLATLRATGIAPEKRPDVGAALAGLGQPAFAAPFPIGWPDRAADWAGPEAVMRRIDWAFGFAGRASQLPEPTEIADTALGPLLAPATLAEMRRAGSRRDQLTLLLTSPEFQRR